MSRAKRLCRRQPCPEESVILDAIFPSNPATLSYFPDELLIRIFSSVDSMSRKRLERVSPRWLWLLRTSACLQKYVNIDVGVLASHPLHTVWRLTENGIIWEVTAEVVEANIRARLRRTVSLLVDPNPAAEVLHFTDKCTVVKPWTTANASALGDQILSVVWGMVCQRENHQSPFRYPNLRFVVDKFVMPFKPICEFIRSVQPMYLENVIDFRHVTLTGVDLAAMAAPFEASMAMDPTAALVRTVNCRVDLEHPDMKIHNYLTAMGVPDDGQWTAEREQAYGPTMDALKETALSAFMNVVGENDAELSAEEKKEYRLVVSELKRAGDAVDFVCAVLSQSMRKRLKKKRILNRSAKLTPFQKRLMIAGRSSLNGDWVGPDEEDEEDEDEEDEEDDDFESDWEDE